MCLNIGTPKKIKFPFETNGKLMVLGVPILKHFRVATCNGCKVVTLKSGKVEKCIRMVTTVLKIVISGG